MALGSSVLLGFLAQAKSFSFPWEKLQQQSFSCLEVNGIAASLRLEKQEWGCPIPALSLGDQSQEESTPRGSSP